MQIKQTTLRLALVLLPFTTAAQTTYFPQGSKEQVLIERLEIKAQTDSVLNFSKNRPYSRKQVIPRIARMDSTLITTKNGAIQPGDYLTSSDTPGVAMRATGNGPVIGMATTGFSGAGEGRLCAGVEVGSGTTEGAGWQPVRVNSVKAPMAASHQVLGMTPCTPFDKLRTLPRRRLRMRVS